MSQDKSELPLKILFVTSVMAILFSLEPVQSLVLSLVL